MIIQSETIMSVVSSFEQIAKRSDDVASKYLANALKTQLRKIEQNFLTLKRMSTRCYRREQMHSRMHRRSQKPIPKQ